MQNTLKELGSAVKKAESILIFTHLNMDGDAVGSSCALCRAFRQMGKTCFILFNDEEVSDSLRFMVKDYAAADASVLPEPDLALAVDASQTSRFPRVADAYLAGKTHACLDHHVVRGIPWEIVCVDPDASASGELAFELLETMGVKPDKETAECLFAAITTDSGNFQYSNTTARTHRIAAKLYESGIDANAVSNALYEQVRPEKLLLKGEVLSRMKLLAGGRAAISCVTQELLKKTGAVLNDGDGIVADLRSMKGVEIAVILKEESETEVYGSFRAKRDANVRVIAESFGGGGHEKAAGCTFHQGLADAYERTCRAVEEALE